MLPTQDPGLVLEARSPGYRRYRRLSDGRRWEVHGECDGRGSCIVGAVLADGTYVKSLDHLAELRAERGADYPSRLYTLDCPFSAEATGSCCPLTRSDLETCRGN